MTVDLYLNPAEADSKVVNRVIRQLIENRADVRYASHYGVLTNDAQDYSLQLQNAIDDTPDGGTLVLPEGTITVSGSGSAILTITKSISIVGQGWGSAINADSSVPNTRDIILVVPPSSARYFNFENFRISNSGSARHGINFDGTSATLLYEVKIDNMLIDATAGGKSINAAGSSGGTLAYSQITRCLLDTISADDAGDGLVIADNVIGGAGISIYYDGVAGAGGLVIRGNVLSGTAGQITIDKAANPIIDGNELEQAATSTAANGAMIDLIGTNFCLDPKITNNSITDVAGGVTGAIRVAKCWGAVVDGNRINIQSTNKHIVTTSDCEDCRIGHNNQYWQDGTTRVTPVFTDNGVRTHIDYYWDGARSIRGTNTNNSASAGYIGEIISSNISAGGAINLTSNSAANITSLSLTAGDWDVWGSVTTLPAAGTTTSLTVGWLSTVSATTPTPPNEGAYAQYPFATAAGSGMTFPVGSKRISLSATSTAYLGAQVIFATSTCGAYGYTAARRVR